ncbi:MAG: ATP-binding protein [Kiritimatiellae bacterium]|jgi:predicted AAA+ superfamily ATPase|nr:ATP-binding protein [Kiritimatiellia bacterium]
MNKLILSDLVMDQRSRFIERDCGVTREISFDDWSAHERIVVISGVRRCGKSTLLRQFAEKVEDFHYMNFDDERLLEFNVSDFDLLLQCFHERSACRLILLDEIQNIPKWEHFVRRVHDDGYKVVLTGSNAHLLSAELGTHLTGRYVKEELFPFSFREFLKFKEIKSDGRTTEDKARLSAAFAQYLYLGGFPEYYKTENIDLLQQTYEDILFRDIISRYGVRDVKGFQTLAHYLFTNFTSEMNYMRLQKVLQFSNHASVRKFTGYLEQSYLVSEIKRFDYSLKKQHVSGKKIYVIDNAMRNAIAFAFSADRGRLLENMIYLEFRRAGKDVYFFREKNECDFIIHQKSGSLCVQVTQSLTRDNRERELAGIDEALSRVPGGEGLIITEDQLDEVELPSGRKVTVMPAWRWLLGESGFALREL